MGRTRAAPIVAALAVAVLGLAVVARIPGIFGATLGDVVPRLGPATAFGGVGALVAAALAVRSGGARSRILMALGVGWLVAIALDGAFDLDLARRRGVALAALGAGVGGCLGGALRALDSGRATALALALGLAGLAAIAWADRRPTRTELPPLAARVTAPAKSILLITLDTTRRDALGCYGGARPTTPRIDALADSALLFEDATAEAPHTHPAVATLLTSRWPLEHGSVSGSPHLVPGVVTLAEHARAHGYRTAGFLDNPWLGPEFGLARGYEHLEDRAQLRRIAGWLERAASGPFLLHVHFFTPHGPYELRERELDAIGGPRATTAARERVGERVSARTIRRGEVPGRHGFDADEVRWLADLYASEVRAMDREVGALVDLVDRAAGLDRTVVVLAADHGEEFGERGSLHHSHTLYQELVGVPLLVRPAGGVRTSRVDVPVGLIDVAPTILELAGLPPLPGAAGRSLAPLARGEDLEGTPVVVTQRIAHSGRRSLTALRDGAWKLHVRRAGRHVGVPSSPLPTELGLFDLQADPDERVDRTEEEPEQVERMLDALRAWERAARERVEAEARGVTETRAVTAGARAALRALGYGGDR